MSGLIIITTHKSTNHPKSTIRNKFLFIVHISVFQIGLFMVFDIFYNNKNYYENEMLPLDKQRNLSSPLRTPTALLIFQ